MNNTNQLPIIGITQNDILENISITSSINYNAIDTNLTTYNRTNATFDKLTSVQPSASSLSNARALETVNYIYGLDNSLLTPQMITSTTNNSNIKSLDTQIQNGSITNDYSKIGINVYQIIPKTIQYKMGGWNGTATANMILGGIGSSILFTGAGANNYGLANPRTWYANMLAAGTSKTLTYDYVNSNGDLIIGATATAPTGFWQALANNIISINRWKIGANMSTSDTLYLSHVAGNGGLMAGGSYAEEYVGVITIPNNAIGFVTNISLWASTVASFVLLKWDVNGNRSVIYTWYKTSNLQTIAGYEGCFGGIINAGESIAFGRLDAVAGAKAFANVVIKYLS